MAIWCKNFILISVLLCAAQIHAKTIKVAIIYDGQSMWSDALIATINKELTGFNDRDVQFELTPEYQLNSNWSPNKASELLDRLNKDESVTAIVGLGLLSSNAIAQNGCEKACIAATIIDAERQGIAINQQGASATPNVHFIQSTIDIIAELKTFQQATAAKRIGIVSNKIDFESIPLLSELIVAAQEALQISVEPVLLDQANVQYEMQQLSSDMEALFVLPLLHLTENQVRDVADVANSRRLPSFTMMGASYVESGFLMGSPLVSDTQELGRRVALDLRDKVAGGVSSLPVSIGTSDKLTINMQTAEKIGVSLPFEILIQANLINEFIDQGEALSLYAAVDESLKRNLDIAIAETDVLSTEQDTRIARSDWLPQVSADATWQALDSDLAITRQTRTSTLGLGVSQLLYSEQVRGNITSQQFLEKAQQAAFDATRLDVIEETSLAYLDLLIAKTELSIQRENLRLTIANLERAQFRRNVGATDRAEVLRFETELGNNRQTVTNAFAGLQQAQNNVNRILHRPISAPLNSLEPELKDPSLFGDDRIAVFLNSPRNVEILSAFLTTQSIENAPELVSLKNEISAQERQLLVTQRKRFVPDVSLNAEVDRVVDDNATPFVSDYNNDWSVGVQFSWTLYQGSKINAERSQAEIQLQRLKYQYDQAIDTLETNTRAAVLSAASTRVNIDFSIDAAEAAQQTLLLVQDQYNRGRVTYIDVIDAQNSLLSSRLSSANAIYTHIQELIRLQRAIGFFDFYISPEQENQWFSQLNQFAENYTGR